MNNQEKLNEELIEAAQIGNLNNIIKLIAKIRAKSITILALP